MVVVAEIKDRARVDTIGEQHVEVEVLVERVVFGDVPHQQPVSEGEDTLCPVNLDVEDFGAPVRWVYQPTRTNPDLRVQSSQRAYRDIESRF